MPPDQTNIIASGQTLCSCCTASFEYSAEVLSTPVDSASQFPFPSSRPRTVRRIVIAVEVEVETQNSKPSTLCTIEILQRFHKLGKNLKRKKKQTDERTDRKRGLSTSASIEAKEMADTRVRVRAGEREGGKERAEWGKFVSNETADGFYIRKFSTTTTELSGKRWERGVRCGRRWGRSRAHRQKKRL